MYLRCVVPEIEHGDYHDLDLIKLPKGLENYYDDHWRRMRGKDEEAWFEYRLPALATFAVLENSVSMDLLTEFTGIARSRLNAVLEIWSEFLHASPKNFDGDRKICYSIYHRSYYEFRFDLVRIDRALAKVLC